MDSGDRSWRRLRCARAPAARASSTPSASAQQRQRAVQARRRPAAPMSSARRSASQSRRGARAAGDEKPRRRRSVSRRNRDRCAGGGEAGEFEEPPQHRAHGRCIHRQPTSSRARGRASAAARSRRCRSRTAVEPAADEHADQRRQDDGPAEHADLREVARRTTARPRAASVAGARPRSARSRPADRVRRARGSARSCSVPDRAVAPLRAQARMIWRIAVRCRRALSPCAPAAPHRSRRGSARAPPGPASPDRRRRSPGAWRSATSRPALTESTPRRTAQ